MAETAVLPPYHDLLVVVLGQELPGQLGSGWMERGFDADWGSHRWTSGHARLRLSTVPAPMRLCVRIGVPALGLVRPLSILVNGRRVWRGRPGVGSTTVKVNVPPSLVTGDSMTVTLLSRRSVPREWGAGGDTRALGTMVQRVWVEAVEAREHSPVALRARWKDWLAPMGAGLRERNLAKARSAAFWMLFGPLFLLCSVIGLPLLFVRWCGRAVVRSWTGAGVRECESAGVRSWGCDSRSDPRSPIPDPPQLHRDAAALEHLLGVVQERAREGVWNLGSLRDFQWGRLWRRQCLQPGQRVLDLGCHVGQTLGLLQMHFGIQGLGADAAFHPLSVAKSTLPMPLVQCRSDHLPFREGSVDLVHLSESCLQSDRWEETVRQSARTLSCGGRLVLGALSSQCALTWHAAQRWLTGGRLGGEPPGAFRRFHPKELARLLEQEGMQVDRITRHHAFFSLLSDEQIPLASHPGLWRMGRRGRSLLLALFPLVEAVIHCADEPWIWLGQSNAFTLEAHRSDGR